MRNSINLYPTTLLSNDFSFLICKYSLRSKPIKQFNILQRLILLNNYSKVNLAPWRVLVIDKWRRFAPPDKHTPT